MNRIEEIKDRVTPGARIPYREVSDVAIMYISDVQYLLSKLEIAEKALDVAEKHISGTAERFSEREKTPVLYQINAAIKQIRE